MKNLFWDIDGTLLLSARAGIDALKEAIRIRYNCSDFTFSHELAGCTDSHIIKTAITDIKGSCKASDAAGLLILYYRLLPEFLQSHQGRLLPNVKNVLTYLKQNETGYTSALLTGNVGHAAHMKLKHYGIENYFDYSLSAFGELSEDRTILAQAAFQKIYVKNPAIKPEEVTIIGDTPNDIKCANAIGVRSLIVLAGSSYSTEELAKHKPWKIIKKLPDNSQEFLTELADRS